MRSNPRKTAVIGLLAILSLGLFGAVVADDSRLSFNRVDTPLGAGGECEQVCALPQRGPVDDGPSLGKLGYALFVQSEPGARVEVTDVNDVHLGL